MNHQIGVCFLTILHSGYYQDLLSNLRNLKISFKETGSVGLDSKFGKITI
ncbi:unnamed protein product [Moneuplotes crassus]|uniref:Uncharacterized protein n=1 Tax=Euplotes crassus TaxID=5936 RepID=A0AAD1XQF9_EUPCR|nr:unnamed protein product [Moneuplotes crassus]